MDNGVMLFKAPGPHDLHGMAMDYVIVEDHEVDATVAAGWFRTTTEAQAAYLGSQSQDKQPAETQVDDDGNEVEHAEPAKRKPGRPRKAG